MENTAVAKPFQVIYRIAGKAQPIKTRRYSTLRQAELGMGKHLNNAPCNVADITEKIGFSYVPVGTASATDLGWSWDQ